jgi:tetratricopeptide (TPR) repeat protein
MAQTLEPVSEKRKALKHDDAFVQFGKSMLGGSESRTQAILISLVGLLVVILAIVFFMQMRASRAEKGMEALFAAQKSMGELFKGLKPDATPDFATFAPAMEKIAAVADEYSSTLAGFEARMTLGNLNFEYAKYPEALAAFEKALESAPGAMEKAMAWLAIGSAQESSGKCDVALGSYDRALTLGAQTQTIRGEALLSTARCQEILGKKDDALKTYERISKDLPATPAARLAETLKARL